LSNRDTTGLERLLHAAVGRAKASDANAAIAAMRIQEGSADRPAMSYEVVLPPEAADDYLTGMLMPRLVYFLDCAGFKLPRSAGVFLSVYRGEELLFIRAADAIAELSRISGLSPAAMVAQFGSSSANR
jgi:hypothetical protein